MPQEPNRLHKWTAIAAAILLCLNALFDLYNHFQYSPLPNPWYACSIFIPAALNIILAVFLFRRKKDIATGCIFICQIVYPILIAPLFHILWIATDHVIVQTDHLSWLRMLLMLNGSAYLILMALDCFLSSRQALRRARIGFLILPALSVVCNIISDIVNYAEAGLVLDTRTVLTLMAGSVIFTLPSVLTGLSFFLSYVKKTSPENPAQL